MLHIREYLLLPELPGNALPVPFQFFTLIELRQLLSEAVRLDWARRAQSDFERCSKTMAGRKLPTLDDYVTVTSAPDGIRS
jgi:hypothetical protein